MAHTKSQGAVKKNRDSISKRLGVKAFGGETVKAGSIIIRQKGNRVFPGSGVQQGKDRTLFAMNPGIVTFKTLRGKKYVEVL